MSTKPDHWHCPHCDLGGRVVLENDLCLFLQWQQPVLVGSGLIVPREHRRTLFDLTAEEWASSWSLLRAARDHLDRLHAAEGYNVGWNVEAVAGQELFHTHMHVIPRFADEPLAGRGIRYWLKQPGNIRPGRASGGSEEG